MSDQRIRELERQDGSRAKVALLAERLRADQFVPAYTTHREPACTHKNWTQVECQAAQHKHPAYTPHDLLSLCAFLGDSAALELCPEPDWYAALQAAGGPRYPNWTLVEWTQSLVALCARLPAKRTRSRCSGVLHSGALAGIFGDHDMAAGCTICHGTGHVELDVAADRWLMTVAAHAVGRAGLERWGGCEGMGNMEEDGPNALGCDACKAPRKALNAASAWIDEPTTERRHALADASTQLGGTREFYDACQLYASGDFDQAFLAWELADSMIPNLREVATADILKALL